jgi:hypothetical protein
VGPSAILLHHSCFFIYLSEKTVLPHVCALKLSSGSFLLRMGDGKVNVRRKRAGLAFFLLYANLAHSSRQNLLRRFPLKSSQLVPIYRKGGIAMHFSDKSNMDMFKTLGSAVTILAMGLSAVGLVYCAVKGFDGLRGLVGRRTPEKN